MKIKNLILLGAAIFLAACSDKEDMGNPNEDNGNNTSVLVGLNIKDAKYIYGSENNTRSSSIQYRQIKKDGTDMQLGWITEKGDTVEVKDITNIWDINEKYLLVNTDSPVKLEKDKLQYDENGNELPSDMVTVSPFGYSYLIDKQTESVFEIKGNVKIGDKSGIVNVGLNGGKAVTDNDGNIYMSLYYHYSWVGKIKPILFKIYTQDPSDLKIENYAEINSEDYFYNEMKYDWFVINNQGTCFYDMRYIRPYSGSRQYTIGQFIKGSTYGAGFISPDKRDLYLTAIGKQDNDNYLTITKLSDNDGNSLLGEEAVKVATDFYEPEYKICTLWNQFKNSVIISAGGFYEFNMSDYSITPIEADLWGFFQKNSYTTTTASFIQNSVDKLTIVSLRDYSSRTVDLANEGIDLRYIYTMEGSEFLHFSGFRYTDSQSVVGTIDENGNVAISETLPVSTVTTIVQIK